MQFRQAKDEVVTASKVAYRFLAGIAANNNSTTTSSGTQVNSQNGDANRGSTSSRFQGAWFKNLMSAGAKPSNGTSDCSSSEIPSANGKDILQSDNHRA